MDGPAGVGKTSLLVHAAWTLRPQHPDAVLFLDRLTHHSPEGDRPLTKRLLQRLLRTLGMADADVPQDRDDLIAAWRDATSGLRLLLVLDDVGSAAQVRPLLPAGPGSRVLVAGWAQPSAAAALVGGAASCAASRAEFQQGELVGSASVLHRPRLCPFGGPGVGQPELRALAARMAREERRRSASAAPAGTWPATRCCWR
ncbi:hypothetical protein AB0D12_37705 [Streptomyces sp. NPDC048479]|uniref:hypothetical protein n=1 Tax=Streptomyces sp. NPDC048479 TaxID=3154725 RepID=UPI003426EAD6